MKLLQPQLKCEVDWESFTVSFNSLHQCSWLDPIQSGEIQTEHDFLPSNEVDSAFDIFERCKLCSHKYPPTV